MGNEVYIGVTEEPNKLSSPRDFSEYLNAELDCKITKLFLKVDKINNCRA